MNEHIQSIPTSQTPFAAPYGPNLVATGARYSAFGRKSLFGNVVGATYVWVGVGGETCSNDGNPCASNVPFVATVGEILLQGTPDAIILATVRRVNRPA